MHWYKFKGWLLQGNNDWKAANVVFLCLRGQVNLVGNRASRDFFAKTAFYRPLYHQRETRVENIKNYGGTALSRSQVSCSQKLKEKSRWTYCVENLTLREVFLIWNFDHNLKMSSLVRDLKPLPISSIGDTKSTLLERDQPCQKFVHPWLSVAPAPMKNYIREKVKERHASEII